MKTRNVKRKSKKSRKVRKQTGGVGDDDVIDMLMNIIDKDKVYDFIRVGQKLKTEIKALDSEHKFTKEFWKKILKGLFDKYFIKIEFSVIDDVADDVLMYYSKKDRQTDQEVTREITQTPASFDPVKTRELLDKSYDLIKTIIEQPPSPSVPLPTSFRYILETFSILSQGLRKSGVLNLVESQWIELLKRLHQETRIKVNFDGIQPDRVTQEMTDYYEQYNRETLRGDRESSYIDSVRRQIEWDCRHCHHSNQMSNPNCQRCGYYREYRDPADVQDYNRPHS